MMKKALFGLAALALLSCEKTEYSPDPPHSKESLLEHTQKSAESGEVLR
ncbi:hypothetical protein [Parapedobacter indicus]|nr:hypothetical protein [Parapedobacter indicus]